MPQSISLILGSGGARGLAHIGAIQVLHERGFQIDGVVGCSMGALIGGFYCADKLDTFEEWVSQLTDWDVIKFLDISLISKAGLMKGDLIIDKLRTMVGDIHIEDLPLPFCAVATDIGSKKEVWLNKGSLFDAIRASISIPGLFTPKQLHNQMLVDGGLLNPIPCAPAMLHKTDLKIAVSLSGYDVANPFGTSTPAEKTSEIETYRGKIDRALSHIQDVLGLEKEETTSRRSREMNMTDVMLNTFDTMQSSIARYRIASYPPDLLIEIPANICETHEFYKAKELIAAGRYWTEKALNDHRDKLVLP